MRDDYDLLKTAEPSHVLEPRLMAVLSDLRALSERAAALAAAPGANEVLCPASLQPMSPDIKLLDIVNRLVRETSRYANEAQTELSKLKMSELNFTPKFKGDTLANARGFLTAKISICQNDVNQAKKVVDTLTELLKQNSVTQQTATKSALNKFKKSDDDANPENKGGGSCGIM